MISTSPNSCFIKAPVNVLGPKEESILDIGKSFFRFYLNTHQKFKSDDIFPQINNQSSFLSKVLLSVVFKFSMGTHG